MTTLKCFVFVLFVGLTQLHSHHAFRIARQAATEALEVEPSEAPEGVVLTQTAEGAVAGAGQPQGSNPGGQGVAQVPAGGAESGTGAGTAAENGVRSAAPVGGQGGPQVPEVEVEPLDIEGTIPPPPEIFPAEQVPFNGASTGETGTTILPPTTKTSLGLQNSQTTQTPNADRVGFGANIGHGQIQAGGSNQEGIVILTFPENQSVASNGDKAVGIPVNNVNNGPSSTVEPHLSGQGVGSSLSKGVGATVSDLSTRTQQPSQPLGGNQNASATQPKAIKTNIQHFNYLLQKFLPGFKTGLGQIGQALEIQNQFQVAKIGAPGQPRINTQRNPTTLEEWLQAKVNTNTDPAVVNRNAVNSGTENQVPSWNPPAGQSNPITSQDPAVDTPLNSGPANTQQLNQQGVHLKSGAYVPNNLGRSDPVNMGAAGPSVIGPQSVNQTGQSDGNVQSLATPSNMNNQANNDNQSTVQNQGNASPSNANSKVSKTSGPQSNPQTKEHGQWVFRQSNPGNRFGVIRGSWNYLSSVGAEKPPIAGQWVFQAAQPSPNDTPGTIQGQWIFKADKAPLKPYSTLPDSGSARQNQIANPSQFTQNTYPVV